MNIKRLQGQLEKQKGVYYEYDADSTPIGEGGMGVVYRGVRIDERTGMHTEVAIKALHDDLPEEVYARAEREASIQLRHDNLVEMLGLISIYETNQWGEKEYHHYVISEFLHGIELSDLLQGKLDNKFNEENSYARYLYNCYLKDRKNTSIKIIKNILSGVLALHDKGYIHRDIDPSNIMVTNDGHIKLIDFGIAKNIKALSSNDKLRTATGKFIGKAEYASPELVLGDVKNQNYTTDIYALGILLYRLLVGELPFSGSQYEVLQYQLKRKVPVNNIESIALAKVVKKSTEKIQSHRYSTIAEFRVAIDKAENKENSFFESYGKYIIACIVLVVIGIGGWLYWDFKKEIATKPIPMIVESPEQQYQHALSQLDSNIPDSIKKGFDNMKELANSGFDKAKIEIGITYLSGSNNPIISNRREILKLNNNEIYSAENIIKELSSIKDKSLFAPEVYYILGIAYYWSGDKVLAIESFQSALNQINNGTHALHGFDTNNLKNVLQKNLTTLLENE